MKHATRAAVAATALFAGAAMAQEPTKEQLAEQIQKLEARIAQLETAQNQPSSAVVDATMQRVLEDAHRRSQLLADGTGFTAGYDKNRFFLRSDDGNFLLMPAFVFQVRHNTNYRADDGGDTQNGFEIRRMRIIFEGNAVSPDLTYKFQWESRNTDGGVFLQDAWARYKFAQQWRIEVGQFKDTAYHEENVPDQFTLSADRSFINALIGGGNIDRVQGAMLMYDDADKVRANFVLHDGYNSKNTDFTDAGGGSAFVGVRDTNFGVSGRAEYLVNGTWKQYDDFSALGNTQDLLVVGAGANFSQGGDDEVLFHTADIQYENANGLGAYGALMGMWRDIGADSTIPAGSYYDWGAQVQAGYLIRPKVELFGRYEFIDVDADALVIDTSSTLHEFTVGANYFMHAHAVKFTVDLNYLPNGSPASLPGLGILDSEDDQVVLRFQAQLVL
jgi:outer membrane murein-binding lipoprotein Lpp